MYFADTLFKLIQLIADRVRFCVRFRLHLFTQLLNRSRIHSPTPVMLLANQLSPDKHSPHCPLINRQSLRCLSGR